MEHKVMHARKSRPTKATKKIAAWEDGFFLFKKKAVTPI